MKGEFQIRLSKELKTKFEDLCIRQNCSITDGVTAFIEHCAEESNLPFRRTEISKRERVNIGEVEKLHIRVSDTDRLNLFKGVCDDMCISYSVAVKTYIKKCINDDKVLYID